MTSSPNTGPTGPGWIREQIEAHERTWPLATLGAGLAVCCLMDLCMGVWLWTAASVVYYAHP